MWLFLMHTSVVHVLAFTPSACLHIMCPPTADYGLRSIKVATSLRFADWLLFKRSRWALMKVRCSALLCTAAAAFRSAPLTYLYCQSEFVCQTIPFLKYRRAVGLSASQRRPLQLAH